MSNVQIQESQLDDWKLDLEIGYSILKFHARIILAG